jgi:hypothetical protein
MTDDSFECSELTGKTIRKLTLYKDSGERCEVLIEFTDGTTSRALWTFRARSRPA